MKNTPPPHAHFGHEPEQPRPGLFARLIDAYHPGITMLVLVWVVGVSARRYLALRNDLSLVGDEALTSLIYVVPIMLVGWGVHAISKHLFGLGLFPSDGD
jgi:hypothetical protein